MSLLCPVRAMEGHIIGRNERCLEVDDRAAPLIPVKKNGGIGTSPIPQQTTPSSTPSVSMCTPGFRCIVEGCSPGGDYLLKGVITTGVAHLDNRMDARGVIFAPHALRVAQLAKGLFNVSILVQVDFHVFAVTHGLPPS